MKQPDPRTTQQIRRDLRYSTRDAMLFSVMVGCGEAYFVAFALAMGMGEALAGLLGSVPLLAGALLQLIGPWAVSRLGSHKRWVVLTAGLQGLSFLPMIIAALMGRMPAWLMFVSVGIYWALNLGGGPAWNTWIGTIVPGPVRAKYFASRSRRAQFMLMVSLIGAGLLLYIGKRHFDGEGQGDAYLKVFAGLFAIAGLARLGSTWCHARVSEPVPMPEGQRKVPISAFLRGPNAVSGGRLLLYMLCLTMCAQVSGPFFAPYMLKALGFDYLVFAGLLCCSFLGRVVAMPLIGRFAKKHGASALLWVGGLGVIPMSAIWVISPSPWFLICVQFTSGVMWASYEMATMLMLLESIPANERTSVLTTQNALNAAMMVVGATCGALLFRVMGEDISAYHALFLTSASLRVGTLILLARVHMPKIAKIRPVVFRTMSLRPQFGGFDRPVVSSIDDADSVTK
ncbi:MAG: MFS transporter [Phycisphaerae bacterium]|nr:MFS transporter [Phycisphaerae bacterium]